MSKDRVGEVRPNQLMFMYGVGAIVDLPKISVIVTGLEDWPTDPNYVKQIVEDRLLQAVRFTLPDVKRLLMPPIVPDSGPLDPFDETYKIGVPVAAFPRWMVCPECHLLAPLSSGLFELKTDLYHPDRTVYRHTGCNRSAGRPPDVVPARFLVACEQGHLDDFPWVEFVHHRSAQPCLNPLLHLIELGPSGEARDLEVSCETCQSSRRLADAFGSQNRQNMPDCRGRRPHLRDYDPAGCQLKMRSIILGASNAWFPVIESTIAIPVDTGRLSQLINEHWAVLHTATTIEVLHAFRTIGQLGPELSQFSDDEILAAIQLKQRQDAGELPPPSELPDLKLPEWQMLIQPDPALNSRDFRLRQVPSPVEYSAWIEKVVLVERLREVRALIGFTRIDSFGEMADPDFREEINIAPISRTSPTWVPANEVRGEGIFIQFREDRIAEWVQKTGVHERDVSFFEAHKRWRKSRMLEPEEDGFPGMRYVLLHSFSHALMRQFSLECGYSAASIRERIYSRPASSTGPAMAGILIYTAAPDSEGTLGGLVSLGEPQTLGRHIAQAFEAAHLCASDPLCAEHPPSVQGQTLHAAACHACLFAPETACERGNRYLDRSTMVHTVEITHLSFFE
jgi:hypothetical protein